MYIYIYIYIYIYLSLSLYISYPLLCTPVLPRIRPCERKKSHLGAPLGSKLDLYCQVGLPRGTWAPIWAAKVHLDASLSSNLASKCPPRVPPTPQNHAPVHTRTQIQQIAFCALQVLLGCFLAALGACLGAF